MKWAEKPCSCRNIHPDIGRDFPCSVKFRRKESKSCILIKTRGSWLWNISVPCTCCNGSRNIQKNSPRWEHTQSLLCKHTQNSATYQSIFSSWANKCYHLNPSPTNFYVALPAAKNKHNNNNKIKTNKKHHVCLQQMPELHSREPGG